MFAQTEKKLNELPKDVRKTLMKKEYKAMKQNLQLAHGVDKVLKKYLRNDGHYIFFCRNLTHLHKMKRQVTRWLKDSLDAAGLTKGSSIRNSILACVGRGSTPQERTEAKVQATGNKWAMENFNATHN